MGVTVGTLFIVNKQTPCESGYTAIQLERIGATSSSVQPPDRTTVAGAGADAGNADGDGNGGGLVGGNGPGFGLLAGGASLLGAGWFLGRDDSD